MHQMKIKTSVHYLGPKHTISKHYCNAMQYTLRVHFTPFMHSVSNSTINHVEIVSIICNGRLVTDESICDAE